jgi:DNA-binding response OmpR family regulator
MRILIVEDDPGIASFLVKGLGAEGFATRVLTDAVEARVGLHRMVADTELILLDLGLPGDDGIDLLRCLRVVDRETPVIILTARAEVSDKVDGLNAGANDYVTKPFSFDELLARIRAALRTVEQPTATELEVGDLRLDLLTKVAWRAGQRIDLAPREWALLEMFMRHPDQILSRVQILNRVWDYSFDPGSNIVDVYVGYLRKKINRPGLEPFFFTIRGAGYRFRGRAD